jgi:hypothetical protein
MFPNPPSAYRAQGATGIVQQQAFAGAVER